MKIAYKWELKNWGLHINGNWNFKIPQSNSDWQCVYTLKVCKLNVNFEFRSWTFIANFNFWIQFSFQLNSKCRLQINGNRNFKISESNANWQGFCTSTVCKWLRNFHSPSIHISFCKKRFQFKFAYICLVSVTTYILYDNFRFYWIMIKLA